MRTIDNPRRGCGHLKSDAFYLRADVGPDGTLPPFVRIIPAQPFVEAHFRGWKPFQGLAWHWVGERGRDAPFTTDPPRDLYDHMARLRGDRLPEDVGHATVAWASDLVMWVGKEFYPDPRDFIDEAMASGINKRTPVTKGGPPLIDSGRTRLFLAHPRAVNEETSGIFGYTYLTRVVYATDGDKLVPKQIHDLESLGRCEVCKIGPTYDPAAETPLPDAIGD